MDLLIFVQFHSNILIWEKSSINLSPTFLPISTLLSSPPPFSSHLPPTRDARSALAPHHTPRITRTLLPHAPPAAHRTPCRDRRTHPRFTPRPTASHRPPASIAHLPRRSACRTALGSGPESAVDVEALQVQVGTYGVVVVVFRKELVRGLCF